MLLKTSNFLYRKDLESLGLLGHNHRMQQKLANLDPTRKRGPPVMTVPHKGADKQVKIALKSLFLYAFGQNCTVQPFQAIADIKHYTRAHKP